MLLYQAGDVETNLGPVKSSNNDTSSQYFFSIFFKVNSVVHCSAHSLLHKLDIIETYELVSLT